MNDYRTLRQRRSGIKRRALLGSTLALIADRALGATAAKIEVLRPWVRYTRQHETSAYLTLLNHGEEADRLIAVSSPLAERCVLQKVVWKGIAMSMVDLAAVPVPPMSRVELNPKDVRITVTLNRAVERTEKLPLTLTFAQAGKIDVQAEASDRLMGPPKGF